MSTHRAKLFRVDVVWLSVYICVCVFVEFTFHVLSLLCFPLPRLLAWSAVDAYAAARQHLCLPIGSLSTAVVTGFFRCLFGLYLFIFSILVFFPRLAGCTPAIAPSVLLVR